MSESLEHFLTLDLVTTTYIQTPMDSPRFRVVLVNKSRL
jgi:hypothetical protein